MFFILTSGSSPSTHKKCILSKKFWSILSESIHLSFTWLYLFFWVFFCHKLLFGKPCLSEKSNILLQGQLINVKMKRRNTVHFKKFAVSPEQSCKHYHRYPNLTCLHPLQLSCPCPVVMSRSIIQWLFHLFFHGCSPCKIQLR